MGFTAKAAKNCKEHWVMGFLFVFFPEEEDNHHHHHIDPIRRINSTRLLSKAQSTISICALLLFLTLLLFTLSTFEPNARAPIGLATSRRFLNRRPAPTPSSSPGPQKALQGLGTLYRRGTRSMADLVVAHVSEDSNDDELRVFLRALYMSGLTAKSDVVLLFPSSSLQSRYDVVVSEENESFLELVKRVNRTAALKKLGWGFDPGQFKPGKKEAGEPVWGKKGGVSFKGNESGSELTRSSYGSVVGFEASDLDPEDSLSGFFTERGAVPMSLRRWACYPMLLGRVRRNFKHVSLVDAKSAVVLGDVIGPVRNRSPESVHFYPKSEGIGSSRHGRKSSDKAQSHNGVNPGVIAGGARGIRRLSGKMLTEIVRAATGASGQHKRKVAPVTDSGVLSQLVGNSFLLKDVGVVKSGDPVPEASELGRGDSVSFLKHSVVQRGNNSNGHEVIKAVIMKHICSSEIDSSVYRDCQQNS